MLATAIGLYIFLPIAVGGILLGYFLHTRNYEFEYSYFDGDLKFAKIINKSRRKRLPGYKMDEVIAIAPTGDSSVSRYEEDSSAKIKRYLSGYKNAKIYVLVVKGTEGQNLVYFEPDERYLDAVCVKYGYKVRR